MLKNELKVALAILGTAFVPLFAQADQSMDAPRYGSSSSQQQQPMTLMPGDAVEDGQLSPAYVANAGIACADGWDIRIWGDYLYWKLSQDSAVVATQVDQASILNGISGNTTYVNQNPGYTSGFEVGIGFGLAGLDNWGIDFNYTWYKNDNTLEVPGTAAKALLIGARNSNAASYQVGTLTSEANFGFQTLDFFINRSGYQGKNLVVNLAGGLKALWISETYTQSGSFTSLATPSLASTFSAEVDQSNWQLGTTFAMNANWLLGWGFSIMTNIQTTLAYASYCTGADYSGTLAANSFAGSATDLHNYGTIRPIIESFLGMNWGMYFCDQSFRFDLRVGYDFNVYFNQHRELGVGFSNTYLQGLNVGLMFHF